MGGTTTQGEDESEGIMEIQMEMRTSCWEVRVCLLYFDKYHGRFHDVEILTLDLNDCFVCLNTLTHITHGVSPSFSVSF